MPGTMYVEGDFSFDMALEAAMAAFKTGAKKVVIVHRNRKGVRIGHFEFVRDGTVHYYPESVEGEAFSQRVSEAARKHSGLPVIDIYDL